MQHESDAQLMRDYAATQAEAAFAEIVRRHADLVYSAALRQIESADLAQEIAQRVFIDLARKAHRLVRKLRPDESLAPWLYTATRYVALNLLRENRRRLVRERNAMQNLDISSEAPADWKIVGPLLDQAMAELDDQERDALLLRFFKNQDFRTVGQALGVSNDTAQKRVARSLEKLRATLSKKGVTTTGAALSAALAANAIQAAPAGISATLASAALAGAASGSGGFVTIIKIMSMTKIQLGLGVIVVAGLAATVAVQHQSAGKMSGENDTLRQQIAGLTAESESLSNQLQQPAPTSAMGEAERHELMRLRSEVAMLRQQTNLIAQLRAANMKLQEKAETVGSPAPAQPATEEEMYKSHQIRLVNAAKQIGLGARIFANDNNERFPINFQEMQNELGNVTNFGDNVTLDAFEMMNVGKISEKNPASIFAREAQPRQNPAGGWYRVYLLGDGSVQVASSTDGNFDTWEQNNTQPVPAPTQ